MMKGDEPRQIPQAAVNEFARLVSDGYTERSCMRSNIRYRRRPQAAEGRHSPNTV